MIQEYLQQQGEGGEEKGHPQEEDDDNLIEFGSGEK